MTKRVPLLISVAFVLVGLVVGGYMVVIFGDVRIQATHTYRAQFTDVSGMLTNSDVRAAGVPVGKVKTIHLDPRTGVVTVTFTVATSVHVQSGATATVRYKDLVGNRYLELAEGPADAGPLPPGSTIPTARTAPALDLDTLYNGFQPLFQALTPAQVNAVTADIISVFQGQSPTIDGLLSKVGSFTGTLADDDQVIGALIQNLDAVLANVEQHGAQTSDVILRLQQLVSGLSAQRTEVAGSFEHLSTLAGSVADLLDQNRAQITGTLQQVEAISANVNADEPHLSQLLDQLPFAYRVADRQGLYGSTFNFYLCGVQIITDQSPVTPSNGTGAANLTSTVSYFSAENRCQQDPTDPPAPHA